MMRRQHAAFRSPIIRATGGDARRTSQPHRASHFLGEALGPVIKQLRAEGNDKRMEQLRAALAGHGCPMAQPVEK
ncbi:hypothetical protein AAFM71_09615 [Chromobacterium violaceum]|uniref:hypothetical protein n=1 Tax=Chromobacterium violaceum TaxID=536 RepID=UPI0009DA4893|nr:hypothetical protein B0T41_01440 [Chromobacterium violaceum]